MNEQKFTHKGWFWFVPVYLNMDDGEMLVAARWSILDPLFWVADLLEAARIYITSALNPDYEPTFMFRVTGELP